MAKVRIDFNPEHHMTFEEFKEKYGSLFRTSSEEKREKMIRDEYNKIMGVHAQPETSEEAAPTRKRKLKKGGDTWGDSVIIPSDSVE
jgi:hypothetical protein